MLDLFGIEKRKRRRALWTQVAHEHGGEFHLGKGFFRRKNERIEATVDGIPIVLDTYVVSTGNSSQTYTRCAANVVRGPAPKLQIYKQGVIAAIGNVFFEDVALGRTEFDKTFAVRCEKPAVARRMITDGAMNRMLATFRDAKLSCNRKRLELVTAGLWNEEPRLRDAIAIIAELAARDLYGIEALRAIEGGVLAANEQGWPIVEVATSARVVIGANDHEGQLVMVALTSEPTATEPMELEIVDGAARDTDRASRLPPGAHVALRSVGTGVLVVTDKGMQFRWRDLELDPACLRAGADLLGAIAAGQQATAYR